MENHYTLDDVIKEIETKKNIKECKRFITKKEKLVKFNNGKIYSFAAMGDEPWIYLDVTGMGYENLIR